MIAHLSICQGTAVSVHMFEMSVDKGRPNLSRTEIVLAFKLQKSAATPYTEDMDNHLNSKLDEAVGFWAGNEDTRPNCNHEVFPVRCIVQILQGHST